MGNTRPRIKGIHLEERKKIREAGTIILAKLDDLINQSIIQSINLPFGYREKIIKQSLNYFNQPINPPVHKSFRQQINKNIITNKI